MSKVGCLTLANVCAWCITGAVVHLAAGNALSAVMTFDDRTAFESAVTGPLSAEGYEGITPDLQNGARTIGLPGFDIAYDGNSLFGVTSTANPGPGSGVGPTDGSRFVRVDYLPVSATVTATFALGSPIMAFVGRNNRDLRHRRRIQRGRIHRPAGDAADLHAGLSRGSYLAHLRQQRRVEHADVPACALPFHPDLRARHRHRAGWFRRHPPPRVRVDGDCPAGHLGRHAGFATRAKCLTRVGASQAQTAPHALLMLNVRAATSPATAPATVIAFVA